MNESEMTSMGIELNEAILVDLEGVTVSIELPSATEPVPAATASATNVAHTAVPFTVNPTPPPDLLAFMGENKLDITKMMKDQLRPAA